MNTNLNLNLKGKGELPLGQLRKKMKYLQEMDEDAANLQEFVIVNGKAEQQVLQVNLIPATVTFLKATKLYSNCPHIKSKPVRRGKLDFLINILRPNQKTQMLVNSTSGLQIIGAKHRTKNGQILILDLSVYKQSMYYHPEYLIASRKEPTLKNRHQVMLTHQLAQYKDKCQNIFDALDVSQQILVLQSDSVIVEKYLALDQQFCLFDKDSLLAFSKNIQLQQIKGGILKASGPGWLFFQTAAMKLQAKKRTASYLKTIIVLSLFLMLLEISLVTML